MPVRLPNKRECLLSLQAQQGLSLQSATARTLWCKPPLLPLRLGVRDQQEGTERLLHSQISSRAAQRLLPLRERSGQNLSAAMVKRKGEKRILPLWYSWPLCCSARAAAGSKGRKQHEMDGLEEASSPGDCLLTGCPVSAAQPWLTASWLLQALCPSRRRRPRSRPSKSNLTAPGVAALVKAASQAASLTDRRGSESAAACRPKSKGNTRGQRTTKQKLRKNDRMQKAGLPVLRSTYSCTSGAHSPSMLQAMSVSDKKGQRQSKSSASTQRKQQLKHLWTNQQPPPEL